MGALWMQTSLDGHVPRMGVVYPNSELLRLSIEEIGRVRGGADCCVTNLYLTSELSQMSNPGAGLGRALGTLGTHF